MLEKEPRAGTSLKEFQRLNSSLMAWKIPQ